MNEAVHLSPLSLVTVMSCAVSLLTVLVRSWSDAWQRNKSARWTLFRWIMLAAAAISTISLWSSIRGETTHWMMAAGITSSVVIALSTLHRE